jgi:hypothetical protein
MCREHCQTLASPQRYALHPNGSLNRVAVSRRAAPCGPPSICEEIVMGLGTILLIILILLLIGAIPAWPHSRSWGYGPTGGLGLVLVIVLVLLLLGYI